MFQAPEAIAVPETDFEVRSLDTMCVNESQLQHPWWYNLKYALVGLIFGITFVKAEIVSWFRIQEMFRLQSFHMYGVIGTGVVLGALSVWLIKRFRIRTIYGEQIEFHSKKFNKGQVIGGLIFATAATLFVVPVVFSLMHRRKATAAPTDFIPGEFNAA